MKPRHAILASGLVLTAWLAFFGDKTPDDDIAMPVARSSLPATPHTPPHGSPSSKKTAVTDAPFILAVQPRETLIGGAHRTDIPAILFASHSWTPPPPPPVTTPVVPTAPPLPFKYLGKQQEDNGWQVFLGRGDSTYIVKKNDVIDSQYKVQEIAPPSITLLYLPLNQVQSLTIE